MKSRFLSLVTLCSILFIYIFMAFGSSEEKEVSETKVMEKPFEFREYKLGGSNKDFGTFIQFTEKNKLWMGTYSGSINSNTTDGSWKYIDEKNKIISITMESGSLSNYAGNYQLIDSIRVLFRAINGDTTNFYTKFED